MKEGFGMLEIIPNLFLCFPYLYFDEKKADIIR